PAQRIRSVLRDRQRAWIGRPVVHLERARDAVDGPVRLDECERDRPVDLARVDRRRECVAGAENVLLRDRPAQHQTVRARVADARLKATGRLLGDGDIDVGLVGRSDDRGRLDVDVLEIAEAPDPHFRAVDARAVVPCAFELAHFPPDDFIAGPRVAADVDLANVHAPARVHVDDEGGLVLVAVDLGDDVDVGERVAFGAKAVADRLCRRLQFLARIDLAGPDRYEPPELVSRDWEVAGEPHVRHREGLAFADVDRDIDVFLVRRDRHLRRLDVEFEVAAVLIEAAYRLEVGGKLLLRILIVLRIPGRPARRCERHLREELRLAERLVADNVDAGDLRRVAFDDVDVHRDAVPLLRRNRRGYLCRVLAARDVLTLHFLLGAIECRAVEDLRFGKSDVLQRLLESVGVEFLVARDVDLADRRALLDDDDQHPALYLEPHIAEEARCEQGLHRGGGLRIVDAIADLDRQIGEDGPRLGAVRALDANVLHDEWIECAGRRRHEHREQREQQRAERTKATDKAPAGAQFALRT